MNKKLKAFTLLELVVTMALMSIIVTIAYLGYELVHKQIKHWQTNKVYQAQQLTLITILEQDMLMADECVFNKQQNTLICAGENQEVWYDFSKQSPVRKQVARIDTFNINMTEITVTYLNTKQINDGLVKNIKLQISQIDTIQIWEFNKWYSCQTKLAYGD
jgi:prepilin-type N-terminal cleavage/methylation domain-containing protein